MEIYPKTIKDLDDEVKDILHLFNKDCLEEPFNGNPLARKARKEDYAKKIRKVFIK